ncbi:unnamed protein product [Vicia faba]|uniref:BHLH domain-containing protein n=1 Tax=Vicia faba TaxID=3906 RepID=A0AAV0ZI81_VICFA|nr:unnamed protein product [Vicia faba]
MSDTEKFEVDRNGDPMSYSSGVPPDWSFGGGNLVNSSAGLVSIGNSMSINRGDLVGSSPCSSASMVDSFSPNFWDHSGNSQNLGFCEMNVQHNGSSSNAVGIRKDGFGFGRGGHDHGRLEMGWNQDADSGFIERAARFSCFGGGNFGDVMSSYGIPQSMAMYVGGAVHGGRDALAGVGLKIATGGQSQESSDPNVVEGATKGVSPSIEQLVTRGSPLMNDKKASRAMMVVVADRVVPPMLEGTTSGEPSIKGLNSKKRKRSGQDVDNNKANEVQELQSEGAKDNPENQQKGDKQPTSTSKAKQGSQSSDPPKDEYIHVRARRGQATNSHSLAERVRREKISERMKFLQELVPGCSKVTGKAVMLDEIINYVQSLQRQVEFLSMKLATVNPRLDFNIDGLLAKDILHQRPGPSSALGFPLEMSMNFPPLHQPQPGLIQSVIPNMTNPSDILRRAIHPQLSGGFKEPNQMPDMWEDELHNVIQMSFATTAPTSNQDVDGTAASNQMKVEL